MGTLVCPMCKHPLVQHSPVIGCVKRVPYRDANTGEELVKLEGRRRCGCKHRNNSSLQQQESN